MDLYFVTLGGAGEIGMNLALYGFGKPGKMKWLMVDCGVTFGDDTVPGIDLVMPDIRFITKRKRDLVGLVLTHGHEDHLGAVLDLWPHLQCKLFATPFTAGLLAAKAAEDGVPPPPVDIVRSRATLDLDPFKVTLMPVAHSIPESHALGIETSLGKVLHTGDWKIDPTPPLGDITDLAYFQAFAGEGVDVLVGDSTNAVREGRSPSEADVTKELTQLIRNAKRRVAVTLFASNIARIHSIASAAEAAGRRVVVLGRALHRNILVAQECGYLKNLPPFLDQDNFTSLARDKVVAIMTGSQGEPRSALARAARGDHPHVSFIKGDTVIFSSRTIPGNEKAVNTIVNGLVRQGVSIVTDRDHLVHVSGHPRVDELKDLYAAVRPKALIPVHGEPQHLVAHQHVAEQCGVNDVQIIEDGQMARLLPGPLSIVDEIESGRLYKDGHLLLDENDSTLPERRKLQSSGVVNIALAVDERGKAQADIAVELIGVPKTGLSGESMAKVAEQAVHAVLNNLPRARRQNADQLRESVLRAARAAVEEEWGKKPYCCVQVLEV